MPDEIYTSGMQLENLSGFGDPNATALTEHHDVVTPQGQNVVDADVAYGTGSQSAEAMRKQKEQTAVSRRGEGDPNAVQVVRGGMDEQSRINYDTQVLNKAIAESRERMSQKTISERGYNPREPQIQIPEGLTPAYTALEAALSHNPEVKNLVLQAKDVTDPSLANRLTELQEKWRGKKVNGRLIEEPEVEDLFETAINVVKFNRINEFLSSGEVHELQNTGSLAGTASEMSRKLFNLPVAELPDRVMDKLLAHAQDIIDKKI